MTAQLDALQNFLLYCTLINYGLASLWFLIYYFAHDWVYKLHTSWFPLSVEKFDALNYLGIAIYKIGVLLFNLTPYLALCILN